MKNHRGHKEVAYSFKVMKEKNCQLQILYAMKTTFRNEGGITFSEEKKKNFSLADLPLKKWLKEVL